MSEEDLIRFQFQNILDNLVSSKIRPTSTAIISARQPMVLLFEELMNKIEKLQKENEIKDKVIDLMADKLIEYELYEYDATIKRKWKKKTIEYFYKKVEEEKWLYFQ